ncbi:flagellar filament capping protein FliD [Oligoflexia bacterium]|nr:flagellar filament capping protein FliD [Oligoflexia bacterium]
MALINFSGIASGIDSNALIEALLDQKRQAQVYPLQNQVSAYQDTNSALDELSTLLTNFQTIAAKFRVVNGGALAKQAASSDESVVTASANNSAQSGIYNLTVSTLASNATFSFDDRFASTDTAIDATINDLAPDVDRTVSFTVGTGGDAENVDIVMTSTTTASEFVSSFNSASDKSTASMVNVGTESAPSYAIMITSDAEGAEDGTVVLNSVGSAISAFASYDLDQATNASFSIDGITGSITRSSNTINDVISGVTFNLEAAGTATVSVSSDASSMQGAVQELVDAYNEIATFIGENDAIVRDESSGEVENVFMPLASTSLDESVLTSIRNDFISAGLTGNTVNILADFGVTTERDGTLKFDTDSFQNAMSDDPSSVQSILENLGESLAAVDGTIAQYTRFNGLLDQTTNSNTSQISTLENKIADIERGLKEEEEALMARYARLESLIAQMNSQQSSLASILPVS